MKEAFPGIGFSMVYRTMKLLLEAGLVSERAGFLLFIHKVELYGLCAACRSKVPR